MPMFARPDLLTLRLCSMIACAAFAFMFLWLWRGRRSTAYLAHWAASLILYIAAVLAYGLTEWPVAGALLFAVLAGSNIFVASGVALFEGRRPFAPWMAVPSLMSALGFLVAGRDAAAVGLVFGMALFGGMLVRGGRGVLRGRRIAGAALLGYVPGYVCAILADHVQSATFELLAALALLSDQLLVPMLYLGLLSMPGDRALDRLRATALRDPLTGVWNRGWLIAQDRRLAAAGSAVVLVDVDHFKAINDRHGHAAGDAVLTGIARRLGTVAGAWGGDVVRLGGDEFAIVLPAGPDVAGRFAEQVRTAAPDGGAGTIGCTLSVGVAAAAPGELTLDAAIGRADGWLYRAKAGGRDRVAA